MKKKKKRYAIDCLSLLCTVAPAVKAHNHGRLYNIPPNKMNRLGGRPLIRAILATLRTRTIQGSLGTPVGKIFISHQRSHTGTLTTRACLLAISDNIANKHRTRHRDRHETIPTYTDFEDDTFLMAAMSPVFDQAGSSDDDEEETDSHHVLSSWRAHIKRRQLQREFFFLGRGNQKAGQPRPRRRGHDMRLIVAAAQRPKLPCDLRNYLRFVNGWQEDIVTRFLIAALCRNLPLHSASVFSNTYHRLPQNCPLCQQRHSPDHRWVCSSHTMKHCRGKRTMLMVRALRPLWPPEIPEGVLSTLMKWIIMKATPEVQPKPTTERDVHYSTWPTPENKVVELLQNIGDSLQLPEPTFHSTTLLARHPRHFLGSHKSRYTTQ